MIMNIRYSCAGAFPARIGDQRSIIKIASEFYHPENQYKNQGRDYRELKR
jgi:hypothetical protein